MGDPGEEPFQLSEVLSEIYHAKDLLDFSSAGAGPSSPRQDIPASSSQGGGGSGSIFASATSIAAAAGRRAAGLASSQSPISSPGKSRPGQDTGGSDGNEDARLAQQAIAIRCVEGYGSNLYIGRSDGIVEWWTCDGTAGQNQKNPGWTLRHSHTLFPRRPVSRITLLPQLSRCLVLSEGTMHPLSLPFLEMLPSTVIAPLRGVVSLILDDDELEWDGEGSENNRTEMTVVVVRRRGLGMYRMGGRLQPVKEIPLPSPPSVHALASNYLCACLPHSNTYALIDLSDASLTEVLPVSQIDASELDFDPKPNIVVVPGEGEFLVTSYTGISTMGVFLNGQGDPVRGTIEWQDHPLSLAIESGHVIALLRSNIIAIHRLSELETPVQTINLDPGLSSFTLSYSPYGVAIRDHIRDEHMATTRMLLLSGKLAPATIVPVPVEDTLSQDIPVGSAVSPLPIDSPNEEPPSGSGLTPPSSPPRFTRQPITPQRKSSLLKATAPSSKSPFSTTVAETLIVGPDGIQAVCPVSVVTRLKTLCTEEMMDEAIALVEEERRKGRRGDFDGDKASHQATMRLLHLYLAMHLLLETRFQIAGEHLYRGKIDPRLIVRLFKRLRGKVIGSAEEVDVFVGLKDVCEDMPSIEDIITANIKRNYSPHMTPDTEHAPETIELHQALEDEANTMLTEYLKKTRSSRRKGGGSRGTDSYKIDIVIDTVLAKLLAEAGTTNELFALLAGPNDAVLNELEPFLEKRPYVLATVMRQQGRTERVLQILKSIAENENADPLCEDPVDEIAQQLDAVQDPEVFRNYALWLISRDPPKGLAILMSQGSRFGMNLDDAQLLDELRKVSDDAADQYLEYVVVHKRSPQRQLHELLLDRILHATSKQLEDDGVKYHLEELMSEFSLLPEPQPFSVFFADIAPQSPIKLLRLKLMLFLQGSPFYNLESADTQLSKVEALKYEHSIVLGRLGKHRPALQLLARDVHDSISAQTYCNSGGEVIPPKIAHAIAGHMPELAAWATLGDVGRKRKASADAKMQEGLVMELLSVYMKEGSSTSKQTASLLNAQSLHLDALEVLALVPGEWPVNTISTFFQRSLRRQLHDKYTWQILKSIAAGQNLAMSDMYLEKITSIPGTKVDTPQPSQSGTGPSPGLSVPDEGSIPGEDKNTTWAEKAVTSDEKEKQSSGSEDENEDKSSEEGREGGFFSPAGVNKELAKIQGEERSRGTGTT